MPARYTKRLKYYANIVCLANTRIDFLGAVCRECWSEAQRATHCLITRRNILMNYKKLCKTHGATISGRALSLRQFESFAQPAYILVLSTDVWSLVSFIWLFPPLDCIAMEGTWEFSFNWLHVLLLASRTTQGIFAPSIRLFPIILSNRNDQHGSERYTKGISTANDFFAENIFSCIRRQSPIIPFI